MFFGSLRSDRLRPKNGGSSGGLASWRQSKPPGHLDAKVAGHTDPRSEKGKEGTIRLKQSSSKHISPSERQKDISSDHEGQKGLIRRRRSLSNVMQNMRAKLHRSDRSSDGEVRVMNLNEHSDQPDHLSQIESVTTTEQIPALDTKEKGDKPNVPFSGLPWGSLTTSSTFRDGLEKAADDINTKYQADTEPVFCNDIRSQNKALKQAGRGYRRLFCSSTASSRRQKARSSERDHSDFPMECIDTAVQAQDGSLCPCSRNQSAGIPVHYMDKVLEQSISLRTPWENYPPKFHSLKKDEDGHVCEISQKTETLEMGFMKDRQMLQRDDESL